MRRARQAAGQALLEFLVVAMALVLALFLPYLQGRSVVSLLLHALVEYFRARSYLVSIL
jgi:hypothetical protein